MSAFPAVFATTWVSPRAVPVDSSVVVTRKVEGRLVDVVARAAGSFGPLELRGPLAPVATSPVPTWATTGRLRVAGPHLVKFARVEMEISEYSDHACIIEVRPVSPNSARWGQWRFDRYFGLAHDAADALVCALSQPSVQLVA